MNKEDEGKYAVKKRITISDWLED